MGWRHAAPALLLVGCADITGIEHTATYGDVTVIKDWFTSIALVHTDGGPVLVDAGFRNGRIRRALRREGVATDDVVAVLLTHGHGDHIGALDLFEGTEVLALAAEVPTIQAEGGAVTGTLEDGEILAFGDLAIEVLAVPGHTPGSAVYVVGEVALLGDTALVTAEGAISPVAEDRSEDPAQAATSLAALYPRLEGLGVATLVPSHSGAAPLTALQTYAETHETR